MVTSAAMELAERLSALERSVIPVWVYDHDHTRFRWANPAALELWQADSLAELLARDFSNNSPSTRTRLDNYLTALRAGGTVSEDWTLYPRGLAATLTLHGSGVTLDDGRLAVLFQAVQKETPIDPSMIRGVEALRHTSLMVSLVGLDGAAVFHNPAALRAFGSAPSIAPWFADGGAALLAAVDRGDSFEAELAVTRVDGQRWHSLRATPVVDPITSARAALIQQLDVEKRRQAEDLAAARSRSVDELSRMVELIGEQRRQILTLSAPLLDVGERTLAAPLIGDVDRERVQEVSQRLLPAVSRDHARFVILDLTGCHEVHAEGARGLAELAAAVGLLGARVVLTGIHPALAQAMVAAGLDRGPYRTLRSLRDGIEFCRRQPHA
jgi:rsbT co-antagonist protein RsbR